MSDHAHPPAGGDKKSSGGPNPVLIVVLILILVYSNILGMIADQLNAIFRMMAHNAGVLMGLAAVAFFMSGDPPKK